jgi:MoaA/NifB/PqqE/SkfB family radical SAM enzyme
MGIQLKTGFRQMVGRYAPKAVTVYRDYRYAKTNTDDVFEKKLARMRQIATSIDDVSYAGSIDSGPQPIAGSRSHAILEINNTCNIDCLMCKTSLSTRKKGKITEENLTASLDRMAEEGVETVALHTIGDPLSNPALETVFQELRKRRMRAGISTNGLLLHRFMDMFPKYLDVCSLIRFSIDGATKETYERIRFGGNWEQLLENLELARTVLAPAGINTEVAMVVSRDNLSEVGAYIKFFSNYVRRPVRDMSIGVINSLSPDTKYFDMFNLFPKHTYSNSQCSSMSAPTPFIHLNGNFSVCCRDYDGSLKIGNIFETPIADIRKGEELETLRKEFFSGDLSNLPLCATCATVDGRVAGLFSTFTKLMLFKLPDAPAEVYQSAVDRFVDIENTEEKLAPALNKLFDETFA